MAEVVKCDDTSGEASMIHQHKKDITIADVHKDQILYKACGFPSVEALTLHSDSVSVI